MVAYAVGEMATTSIVSSTGKPNTDTSPSLSVDEDGENSADDNGQKVTRRSSSKATGTLYEVVTAWVHPR